MPSPRVSGVEVSALGPLLVRQGGTLVPLNSPMLRWLLGLLALQPHRMVSRDEIVDTLWGEDPPRTCLASIHVYIGRLRTMLDPGREARAGSLISAASGGYIFEPAPGQLDVAEFTSLVAQANDCLEGADPQAAHDLFTEALELWRGPALAGVHPRLDNHPAAMALAGKRVRAALVYADTALTLGHADRAVSSLRGVSHDEPLHEALHARLLLALAASGQQAAALALYAKLRTRLNDELGVDPGPELEEAHLRVLRGQVPTAAAELKVEPQEIVVPVRVATPAQLPGGIGGFTGRGEILRQLDACVGAPRSGAVQILAVTGTPGVGKTALAVHWAHTVRDRFPDGQLFVNLRGYSPSPPLRPIEVLAQFLRTLGLPSEQIPVDVQEAASVYRSLLAGKRMLVVLDDAHSPEQVRPLLPGDAGCAVLITSRDQLVGLAAREGAERFSLDVLTAAEAEALLTGTIGLDRVRAEPDAAHELAQACAYLPLALRIAAANVTSQPHSTIAGYLARLRTGNRLAALQVSGDEQAAVRAAFDLSYDALPVGARRLFRLIGLAPGPDLDDEAAAALAGEPLPAAQQLLGILCSAHLVSQHAPDRYTLHDLLRLYAAERAHAEEHSDERRAARERMFGWYLGKMHAAARLLYPERVRLLLPEDVENAHFSGPEEALCWLDSERTNTIAAVADAAEHGPQRVAWLLADGLRGYFSQCVPTVIWLVLAQTALEAAEQNGDQCGLAATHISLAEVCLRQGQHDQAIKHYRQAAECSLAAGWAEGQAAALGNLGAVCRYSGRVAEAVEHLAESLSLNRRTGRVAGEAAALGGLGIAYRELGELALAEENLEQAMLLFRKIGAAGGEGIALDNLGETYHGMGRFDEAERCFTNALELFGKSGSRKNQAAVFLGLAAVLRDTGREQQALDLASRALVIGRETADSRAEMDALNTLGTTYARMAKYPEAAESHQEALRLARQTGNRYPEAVALVGLADVHSGQGDYDLAADWAEQALKVTSACRYQILEATALAILKGCVTA